MKTKKQTRSLKLIWLGRNICDVFSVAFGLGFFFCGFMAFISDDVSFVLAMLLMFLCGFSFVIFGLMEVELREHYQTLHAAYMAENIERAVKKTRVNYLYEREDA